MPHKIKPKDYKFATLKVKCIVTPLQKGHTLFTCICSMLTLLFVINTQMSRTNKKAPRTSLSSTQPNRLPDWAAGIDEEEAMNLSRFLNQDPLPQRNIYRSLKRNNISENTTEPNNTTNSPTNSTTKQQSSSGLHTNPPADNNSNNNDENQSTA